jgi:protein O-mannosyl-transferase
VRDAALIFVAVLVAYIPALNGRPLWDDFGHITVPELRSLGGLWRVWSETGATQQYYPLLHSAFWFEHQVWGDSMLGYHLANVALHATAAFLLVLILRRLAVAGALLAGLIFALHPVCVESVAWISEQKNTLSAVFYLAAALVYVRNVAGRKPRAAGENQARVNRRAKADQSVVRKSVVHKSVAQPFRAASYWIAFLLFICALLSKTVTATLPAALLVVLWWQRGRLRWKEDVVPLVPWFAIAAVGGLLSIWFERHVIGARGADFTLTWLERCLLAGRAVWFYLGKVLWPTNLTFIYPRWTISAGAWSQYLFPLSAIALGIALWILARRYRGPLAGYLYFCGTLVPVLGFVDVYPFRFSYVADHFQYLASLGMIVPMASTLAIAAKQLSQHKRSLARGLAGVLVVTLGILTWQRSAIYKDAETLYRDTVVRNPESWMAYQNLGTELANQNRLSEAVGSFEAALRVRPDYPEAKRNLVLAHMKLGDASAESSMRGGEAISHYEAVLRIDPNHFRAHYNLGTVLMDVPDRHTDAIAHFEAALKIQPDSPETQVNLGIALAEIPGRKAEALAHLENALAKRPDLVAVRALAARLRAGLSADSRP